MAPRRKRTRRRRRHHYNNQAAKDACHPDELLRNYSEDLRTPEPSRELLLDPATTPLKTPGPRSVRGNSFLFITEDAIEKSLDASSDCASPRTRKEIHRLRPAGSYGLNTSVPSSNVSRASQSCTDVLEDVAMSCSFRVRARSSIPKLHSPEVEKMIPTSSVEIQTILDTPKRPQDYFLDLDYDQALFAAPQSPYRTPMKRTGLNSSDESYNRIEDLNKIGCRDNEDSDHEVVMNRSKNIEPENLRRMQALNNQLLKQVMETEKAIRGREEGRKEEASTSELSFFTPHIYNSKFASTPIKNAERRSLEPTVPIHQQQHRQLDSPQNSLISVLMEGARHSPSVRRSASVSTRRSNSLNSPKKLSLSFRKSLCSPASGRLSLLESQSHEVTATEVLVTVLAWIRKLHGRYIGRITAKISQGCSWFGNSLRRGIAAFIKEYSEIPKPSCSSCETLKSGLDVIKVEMEGRMGEMKGAMAKMQAEIEKLRQEMGECRKRTGAGVVPPAPPPPPPPLPLPSDRVLVINKKGGSAIEKKKKAESSRPVISLKEILNVKLRKTSDRSLPERRHTACAEILQQVKLRPTSSSFYDSKRDRL